MSDFVTSLIRTWTPIIVGSIVGWLASHGLDVSAEDAVGLTAFLTAVFSGLYYLVVRLIERKYPSAGALLGSTKKPEYTEVK